MSNKVTTENIPIGTIFNWSWGWEQTNVNFFQVIAKTEKTLTLQEINSEYKGGDMSGVKMPIKDNFTNEKPMRKKLGDIGATTPQYFIKMEYGWCSIWDGTPQSVSSYA
jgi:hypothetical protein